jgi:hypothetical protein
MVALRNPSKRPVTLVLTHEDAPKVPLEVTQVLHDKRTGEVAHRPVAMRLPDSLTILGGETREGLPDYVRKEALRRGLVVTDDPPPPKEKDEAVHEGAEASPSDELPYALKQQKGS